MNPLDWTAGPFLTFYLAVALSALWICMRFRSSIGSHAVNPVPLSAVQIAYMTGGKGRAGDVILVQLAEANEISVGAKGKITLDPRTVSRFDPNQKLIDDRPITRGRFQALVNPYIEDLKRTLIQAGLAPDAGQVRDYRARVFLIILIPLMLGLAKIQVGISRGKPVGYLTALVIVTAFLGLLLLIKPRLTAAGNAVLADEKEHNSRLARAPVPGEFPMAVALTGLAVLAGTELAPIQDAARAANWAGDGGGGGCGGGGDGGGGCGGGGCGGCGG
jgi:uncharacterized protein (TIGR04222 family)